MHPDDTFRREANYLGQVGCLDHLRELAAVLDVPVPAEPASYGHHDGPTGRASAFPIYAESLEQAQEAQRSAVLDRTTARRVLGRAMAEAVAVRKRLSDKGHPVPGRSSWLCSSDAIGALPRGRQERCPSCHETFSGTRTGDAHRVGRFDVPRDHPEARRCLPPEDVRVNGYPLRKDDAGVWRSAEPYAGQQAAA